MPRFQEEIFGPVVRRRPVHGTRQRRSSSPTRPDTGSRRASGRRTSDARCAWGRRIETGFLWINTINSHPIEAPFGGVKDSGFGREEGLQALENYMVQRSIIMGGDRFVDPYAD